MPTTLTSVLDMIKKQLIAKSSSGVFENAKYSIAIAPRSTILDSNVWNHLSEYKHMINTK